jgi:penicillin-binding protein 1C
MLKKTSQFLFQKHKRKTTLFFLILLVWYWLCLPSPLFDSPTSMVLEDKNGELLGARIAQDGQWRFPYQDSIPEKFKQCIIEFEDRRFYSHLGIDPRGIARAIKQNIQNGKIVSGGSTITMQVMRMARGSKSRTILQKGIEMIQATRLEIKHSKDEILAHYVSNAPFGGNVVGLDAAAWRYFGKNPSFLSWSEAATLAVLPNSPALIHPGRNRKALVEKRNRLLHRLQEKGLFDKYDLELALEEPLPEKPHPLPRQAPHLLDRIYVEQFKNSPDKITRLQTTLDGYLQREVTQILTRHNKILKNNGIHNLAALVIEVETGDILAYVGNAIDAGKEHGEQVDIIKAKRSTGSILKPMLLGMMVEDGEILPTSLVSDIPTHLTGYRPENFHESYDGVVSAKRAIVRSLNVPLVRMLQEYGLEKFHFNLKDWGFYSINQPPQHYGLPLIVGGAETSLWEITNTYACLARTLNHFQPNDGQYFIDDFRSPTYINSHKENNLKRQDEPPKISASSIWQMFETMQEVERPNSSGEWQQFEGSSKIAWKTGTSFGFRDAWASGVTPKFAVGVWAGNADGEGRPGCIGVQAAAPVLFDIFKLLPHSEWFLQPFDEMVEIEICKKSGYRAREICEKDTIWASPASKNVKACPFHQIIHLDKKEQFQVHSSCENPLEMIQKTWFVLPPVEELYYKSKNPNYEPLPSFRSDCQLALNENRPMQLVYPKHETKIYIPKDLDGNLSKTVFKAAHRDAEAVLYWHLNNEYLGETTNFHDLELSPNPGKHTLTLVDSKGNRLVQNFEIIGK